MPVLVLLPLAVFCVYVLMKSARPSWPIQIGWDGQRLRDYRGAPESLRAEIEHFLSHRSFERFEFDIYARRRDSGHIQTKILGLNDPGLRQRIRNFLCEVL